MNLASWGQDLKGTFNQNNSISFPINLDVKTRNISPDFGARKPVQTIRYIT